MPICLNRVLISGSFPGRFPRKARRTLREIDEIRGEAIDTDRRNRWRMGRRTDTNRNVEHTRHPRIGKQLLYLTKAWRVCTFKQLREWLMLQPEGTNRQSFLNMMERSSDI
jgi:hypothetical protein